MTLKMSDDDFDSHDSGEFVERTMVFDPAMLHASVVDDDEKIHILVQQEGRDSGRCIEIADRPLMIGRTGAADIKLADPRISTRHAELRLVGSALKITDLNSTNGTFVDQRRIQGCVDLPVSSKLTLGSFVFVHEIRSRGNIRKANELHAELRKACDYVRALLPLPLSEGQVQTDWAYVPCSILGGDAFGYHELDDDRIAFYLLDVCGHGAGAAMHSVAVINILRQQSLPGVNFGRPDEVLRALNASFDMDRHHGMYFSLWYGVYHRKTRTLAYSSGGHPPALLIGPDRKSVSPLQTRSMSVGTFPGQRFRTQETIVAPGSSLYIFSDGVFEVVTTEGKEWNFDGFRDLILRSREKQAGEAARLQQAVERISRTVDFADDFSLIIANFY